MSNISKAQQKAVHKYVKNNYDRVELTVKPKGKKDEDAYPVYVGEKCTDSRGCFVRAVTGGGDVIEGTELAYRAVAFFARVYCPEVLMGIQVQGEVEDSEPQSSRAEQLTAE